MNTASQSVKYTADQVKTKYFWPKVNKDGPIPDQAAPHYKGLGQCWIWTAYKDKDGYGKLSIDRIQRPSHRISWLIHFGDIPEGLIVLHRCDNPSCVNPSHLRLGNFSDNTKDMFSKGRENMPKGERCWKSKLTAAQVLFIRGSSLMQRELAVMFGVTQSNISMIQRKVNWTHI